MRRKKIIEEIAVSLAPGKPRKNPPKTAYSKEHPSPNAFKPGVSGNPSGGRKPDETRLLSKALSAHLRGRAPDAICAAVGLEKFSSYAQCLSMSLLLRGILKGDTGASALIANLTELGSRAQIAIEQAMADGPSKIELVFIESDGNGRPRQVDIDSGFYQPPATLPAPQPLTIDAAQPTEAELIEAESARLQAEAHADYDADKIDEPEPVPVTPKPKREVTASDRFGTALAKLTGDRGVSSYRPIRGAFRPGF